VADAAITTVWLDNPPLNVIGTEIAGVLDRALDEIGDETRVLVLRGVGDRAFSAGADISGFRASDGGARGLQQLADRIEAAPVPVIAAIHGYCLGGGLELALGCDLRIATRDAQLGFPEVRLGLLPGGGGTQRAPRVIGRSRTAWLVMTGERVDAERAERWGLVDFLVDDLDDGVAEIAGKLANQSPNALREIKQLLLATRDERSDDLESQAFARCLASDEGKEGVAAFLEKRKPSWAADG
jgi:enoyl-CoA hydratase / 3-hydroxyacyl-CoA dehydrogenase